MLNDDDDDKQYELNVNIDGEAFPYASCETQDVILKRHQELPRKYKYVYSQISDDQQYIAVIGKSNDENAVYVWKTDNLNKFLYHIEGDIECFEFASNSRTFIIVYKSKPPMSYNIVSGKPIMNFYGIEDKEIKALCCSFSPKSRFFALATRERFIIWDTISGKVIKNIEDKSPSKYIRKNLLVNINEDCEIRVIEFKEEKEIAKVSLKGTLQNDKDILTCMLSPDSKYFFYATKENISRVDISNGNSEIVQQFDQGDTVKVIISNDCEDAISTNMVDIFYWKLGKGKLGTILKEKFNFISCSFATSKITIIDDISVNIFDYSQEEQEEKFIWLNSNPTSFESFSFSPSFAFLLAIIDEHNAILYNAVTGEIIKKWKNDLPNWSTACLMAPETSETSIIVTKSTEDKTKIWNYENGNEIMTLVGFHPFIYSFSPLGNLLGAGTKGGNEIARVWDLTTGDFNSFNYEGHNNANTIIEITKKEPYKLIAVSKGQRPVVFDIESAKMIYQCSQCPFDFKYIDEIKTANINFFYVKGVNMNKENIAVLFNMNNGNVIKIYNNCVNIDISKDERYILYRSDNDNEGHLTIANLDNVNNNRSAEIDPEISSFVKGSRIIVSPFGNEKKIEFVITEPKNGKSIGNIELIKNNEIYSEIDVTANEEENVLMIRYIQLE